MEIEQTLIRRVIVKALGFALIGILLINVMYLIDALQSVDGSANWSIQWQLGRLNVNGNPVGLGVFSWAGIKFMGLVIAAVIATEYLRARRHASTHL